MTREEREEKIERIIELRLSVYDIETLREFYRDETAYYYDNHADDQEIDEAVEDAEQFVKDIVEIDEEAARSGAPYDWHAVDKESRNA